MALRGAARPVDLRLTNEVPCATVAKDVGDPAASCRGDDIGARVLAALAGLIALVGCTPGTGAGPSAGGSPAGTSAPGLSADPSVGRELRHKIKVGTVRLVLVPFERSDDDMSLVLTNASGLAELKCSERAEPQSCTDALKSISELWRGTKDGWNTGESLWVGHRGGPDGPVLPLLVRHPLGGKIDLVAVLNPARTPGSNGSSPSPSAAPSPSPTRTSTATETPTSTGDESDVGWMRMGAIDRFANGDVAGEGQAWDRSCNPLAYIDSYSDIEEIPDLDDPANPAAFTTVWTWSNGRIVTLCLL